MMDSAFSQESVDAAANSLTNPTCSSNKPKKKKRRLNFGSSSATTTTQSKDKVVGDPTKAGRRKKNRRTMMKKVSSNNNKNDNNSSKSSRNETSCPNVTKYQSKLDKIYGHVALSDTLKEDKEQIKDSSKNPGFLALDALNRIITGKFDEDDNDEENGNVCGEEEEDEDSYFDNSDIECDELEKQNLKNPLIFRNVLIRRSGALPLLSRAMAESLEAAVLLHQSNDAPLKQICGHIKESYKEYLRNRIHCLSSMLDTLCCLSSENRRSLCCTGYVIDGEMAQSSVLIPSLLRTITLLPVAPVNCETNHFFADIALASYRTLTSLTHENDIAAQQLIRCYNVEDKALIPDQGLGHSHGVEMLAKTLHTLAKVQQEIRNSSSKHLESYQQHAFDAIVFSLNTLTNVLETSSSNEARKLISKLHVHGSIKDGNSSMLSWLTCWVVNQTSSFQDAVIFENSGEDQLNDLSQNSNSQRDLEHHEDEFLVQAGNGFILLACFLLGGNESKNDDALDASLDKQIHEDIMSEMPKNDNGSSMGITLIVNTLKAFCNYYKFSIGDLSVAVIDPVRKLISKLEAMK